MNIPQIETPVTADEVLDKTSTEPAIEPEVKPEAPKDERVSPKLAALIRREKIALERERTAKERESALEAKLRAFEERETKLRQFDELWDKNPIDALKSRGKSYQDLVQVALNDGSVPPEMKIRQLEERFDSQIRGQEEALKRQAEDAAKAQELREQETITAFKTEIDSYLKENAERYELISFENCEELVYDVIDAHYERTKDPETGLGEVLTIANAADKVEKHLEEKYDKARNLSKVKTLLAPKHVEHLAKQLNPTPSPKQKTLTNTQSATPTKPRQTTISDEERIAKAIAYARGLRP